MITILKRTSLCELPAKIMPYCHKRRTSQRLPNVQLMLLAMHVCAKYINYLIKRHGGVECPHNKVAVKPLAYKFDTANKLR